VIEAEKAESLIQAYQNMENGMQSRSLFRYK